MDSQKGTEIGKARQSQSHSREAQLKAALYNGGDDMNYVATSMIYAALWPLYESGKLSDLTVTCGGRQFLVHKAIVCSQSPFFDKACNSGFREGIENTIDLPEDEPDIVDRFFQFIYSGNYSDGEYSHSLPPAEAAMMNPRAISERLKHRLVTEEDKHPSGIAASKVLAATSSTVDAEEGDHGQESDEENDRDYTSDDADADEQEETEELMECDSEISECTDPDDLRDTDLLNDTELNLIIFTSLRVYIMAQKYDVPALRLLAKERFRCIVENHWFTYDGFPAVIDELFESTMPNDPLRLFVCQLIVCQYQIDPELRAKIKPLMNKHSALAVGVLDQMVVLKHM